MLSRLYMNGGVWNGTEIVPKEWIAESTTKQIETVNEDAPSDRPVDPWNCGYGYLIWMYPKKNAYRFSGMFGQNSLIFPDQGVIFNFNAHEKNLNALKAVAAVELVDKYVD